MKFGIMSLDFKRLTLEETFQLAQSYGFDGVEIYGSRCHLHPDDFDEALAKTVRTYAERTGMEIPMYTPLALNLPLCICSPNPAERAAGVAYYQKCVDIAAAIVCPRLLVVADHPGYFTPRKQIWDYLTDSMRQICRYARGKHVQVTIEPLTPMESPVVTTVDDCVELLERVDEP